MWLSDTCQANFAIADILGGENPKTTLIIKSRQINNSTPMGQKWSKLGSLNSKVDNWHLNSLSFELNVTFEDIYAIIGSLSPSSGSSPRILKGRKTFCNILLLSFFVNSDYSCQNLFTLYPRKIFPGQVEERSPVVRYSVARLQYSQLMRKSGIKCNAFDWWRVSILVVSLMIGCNICCHIQLTAKRYTRYSFRSGC